MHQKITVLGVFLNRKGLFPWIHMSKFGGPGGEAAHIDYSEYQHTQREHLPGPLNSVHHG